MGMNFEADAIRFAPVVPRNLKANRKIENFRYRNSTLDVTVSGYGDSIKSFKLDGKKMTEAMVPGNLEGHHTVEIVMSNSFRNDMNVNYQPAVWTPLMPVVTLSGGRLSWEPVDGAVVYDVYAGGEKVAGATSTEILIDDEWSGDIQVVAVAADGTPSFPSEPVNNSQKICEEFSETMLTMKNGKEFKLTVDVPESGEWSLSWNYANGTGPVNTDNNCGIRMLYVDGIRAGINIFPHRGTNEWNNWGWTVPEKLELSQGVHTFVLRWEPDADNMDLQINDFKIRSLCLTKQ
jgi:acid stress-induced BolA-like protein IbaG/YrbA